MEYEPPLDMKVLLARMARASQDQTDLGGFAKEVLPQLRRVMNVYAVSVWMPSSDGHSLQLCWFENDPEFNSPYLAGVVVSMRGSLAGVVFLSGTSEIVHDAPKDSRHCSEVDEKTGLLTKELLITPIFLQGSVVGVMEYVNKVSGRFDAQDVAIGEAAAALFAVAVEKSLIFEQLRQANKRLQRTAERRKEALREVIQEKKKLERLVEEGLGFDDVIGRSPKMQHVLEISQKAAASDVTVLLVGESGTGKELIAKLLHRQSSRGAGPFVAENCAAIPESLFASELFGHVRGSFSGADRDRIGLIERAHTGTLFLDEIGDMPPGIQKALLRVIETGEVRPVGATRGRPADFRLITATHRNLEAMVAAATFREDLYYRINVFRIHLPPLRERPEDIEVLAYHFMHRAVLRYGRKLRGIHQDVLHCLRSFPFPGNVRQLKNEIEQAVVLAEEGNFLRLEHFSEEIRSYSEACRGAPPCSGIRQKVQDLERKAIAEALEACGGNKTQAARRLGLSRYGLAKKIKRYGLNAFQKSTSSLAH